MTKEELLRVYSAYLPYGLSIDTSHWDDEPSPIDKNIVHGIIGDYLLCQYGWASTYGRRIEQEYSMYEAKPILYPLEYLTKPIEHEGKVVKVYDILSVRSKVLLLNPDSIYPNAKKGIEHLSYHDMNILIKYHFNVFQLLEDQFINKATLTK